MVFFALRADCRLNMARMSPLRVGVAAVAADDRRGLPLPGMVPARCCQDRGSLEPPIHGQGVSVFGGRWLEVSVSVQLDEVQQVVCE